MLANENIKPNSNEIEKLKQNFPQFFDKDGEFLIDRFMEMLKTSDINLSKEGYELKFLGKSYARYLSSTKTETFVSPHIEENAKDENKNSENLYIVGDNIDALKHLLGSYAGKIKCIYIDPPYNTGSDGFVYPDDFSFDAKKLSEMIGIEEEEAERIINLKGKSSHSAWLTFMYPRLILARELLSDDGVIFISIDDNEQANLKLMCDEIFGEENFISMFLWNKTSTPPSLSKDVRKKYEYIICYKISNNRENGLSAGIIDGGDMPLLNESNAERKLNFRKNSIIFKINGFYPKGKYDRVELLEDIEIVNGKSTSDLKLKGKFKWTQETLDNEIEKGTVFWVKTEKFAIRYERKESRIKVPSNIINKLECNVGTNEEASKMIGTLFNNKTIFDFPKPVTLVKYIANMINDNNSIILNFFSGSATTAHAVMQLNAENAQNSGGGLELIENIY